MKDLIKPSFKKNIQKLASGLKIIILLAFVGMLLLSITLVRDKMLKNANEMGMMLAESYAREEQDRIEAYAIFTEMCAGYINDMIVENQPKEAMQQFLAKFKMEANNTMGNSVMDPYCVVDGEIIAATPWEGDDDYDYASTSWYRDALAALGDIVYSDAYRDVITDNKMITVSIKLEGEGNVLAFDIKLDKFDTIHDAKSLPEMSTYFLFDSSDRIIYNYGPYYGKQNVCTDYSRELVAGARLGKYADYDANVIDPFGVSRSVYYQEMDNGWVAIITIPMSVILEDGWDIAVLVLIILCVVLLGAVILVIAHSYMQDKKVRDVFDTLQYIGDSYFEIYRIDDETNSYRIIKQKEPQEMPDINTYTALIEMLAQRIKPDMQEQMLEDFSIEHLREIHSSSAGEYQREYYQKIGDEYRWVSVQLVNRKFDESGEMILCLKDIDEQKHDQLQQEIMLKNTVQSAEYKVQKKNSFLHNISRDMRTPLNTIMGFIQLAIAQPNDEQKILEYLGKIRCAGMQMDGMLNDIISQSKIESEGQIKFSYSMIKIKKCVDECISSFSDKCTLENKKLTVSYKVSHGSVYADFEKITSALRILILNSFTQIEENGQINVSVEELDSKTSFAKYCFTVENDGMGISEYQQKNIFEPHADSEKNSELDMSYARTLVKQMDSDIIMQSEEGKGSKFSFILQLQIAHTN